LNYGREWVPNINAI